MRCYRRILVHELVIDGGDGAAGLKGRWCHPRIIAALDSQALSIAYGRILPCQGVTLPKMKLYGFNYQILRKLISI